MKNINLRRNQSLLILTFLVLVAIGDAQLTLQVTPSKTINVLADYAWTIKFTTSATRQQISLYFGDEEQVKLSTIAKVYIVQSGVQNELQYDVILPNQVDVNVTNYSNELQFVIKVINVTNGYRVKQIIPSIISNDQTLTANKGIKFESPPFKSCDLSFEGDTWDTGSVMYIDLETANQVPGGTVQFKITHPFGYGLSGALIQGVNVICSYQKEGDLGYSSTVNAQKNNTYFSCSFSTSLSKNQAVTLKVEGINNPPISTNYGPFSLETFDSEGYRIDYSAQCTLLAVKVLKYTGTFNTVPRVSSQYTDIVVTTSFQAPLQIGHTIEVSYEGIQISNCKKDDQVYMWRDQTAIFQITKIDNINGSMQLTSLSSNEKQGQTRLDLSTCFFQMPSSETPVIINFLFKSSGSSYIQIDATLRAEAQAINPANFKVLIDDQEIGKKQNYTFQLTTTHQLDKNCSILIDLPSDIITSQFANECSLIEYSQSSLAIDSLDCFIQNSVSKIINVTIQANQIIEPQLLQIRIDNIINPYTPDNYTDFHVNTYYDSSDKKSLTERGSDQSLHSQEYISRITQKVILTSNEEYTVSQDPSLFSFSYQNSVPLKLGGYIQVQFLENRLEFSEISITDITVNQSAYNFQITSNPNNTFTFKHTATIPIDSICEFTFRFKAPSRVGNYSILNVRSVNSGGKVYEYTNKPLELQIHKAASENFKIDPIIKKSGQQTTYQISFITNVEHILPFRLDVTLPDDVLIENRPVTCSGQCSNTVKIIENSEGKDVLEITVTGLPRSEYQFDISKLKNPRKVGNTGYFIFKTYKGTQQILEGTNFASVTSPNSLTSNLNTDQFYYRFSQNSINIKFTPSNTLAKNDYLLITFDYRTYTLYNQSAFKCTYATCSDDVNTESVLIIKAIMDNDNQDEIWINGLQAYGGTIANDRIIEIQSYTQDGGLMDKGQIVYQLTCSYPQIEDKLCKKCDTTAHICTQCYTDQGFTLYLDNNCTNNCGTISKYETFPGSDQCLPCTTELNNCKTCIAKDKCLSCIDEYYLYEDQTCKDYCLQIGYYNDTLGEKLVCLPCYSSLCEICLSGSSNGCLKCKSGAFLIDGFCSNQCGFGTYSNGTACLQCDQSCSGCLQAGNNNCQYCAVGFYDIDNRCLDGCSEGSVLMKGTCGCDSPCQTCERISTYCLSCQNSTSVLYNGQCLEECPTSTFYSGGNCLDCASGCFDCNPSSCIECLLGYDLYENKCYTECNDIDERYVGVKGKCIECPQGCDVCNANYSCSICLSNYTLVNQTCILTCQLNQDCQPIDPVPQQIIPLPGLIATGIWLLLVVVFKLLILKGINVAYSFVFLGCIIEFSLIIGVLVYQSNTIQAITDQIAIARLLQKKEELIVEEYQSVALGLLATTIALNYISNIVYIVFFCKYLKQYIADRQVDTITNYVVLVLGTLSNYRFSLLCYSKMFPKPKIQVQNQSNLTPLHYLCISSIFISLFPLVSAGILIYNQHPLTDLFMLSIDLLIILIINILFSIWMVSTEKPEEYFETTKKYNLEQNYITEENMNQKDQKNISGSHLIPRNNNVVNIVDIDDLNEEKIINEGEASKTFIKGKQQKNKQGNQSQNQNRGTTLKKGIYEKSDNQNQPLPNIPIRSSHINLETLKVQQERTITDQDIPNDNTIDLKVETSVATKRKQRNRQNKPKNQKEQEEMNQNKKVQEGINSRRKEAVHNYSKQKIKGQKKHQQMKIERGATQSIEAVDSDDLDNDIFYARSSQLAVQSNIKSGIIRRQKKPQKIQTQRSAAVMPKQNMKKRDSYGVFQSDQSESIIDQIDLESIIQSKMVDKTKQKKQKGNKTEIGNQDAGMYEQISPSWFNIPNQRYDLDDEESSDV